MNSKLNGGNLFQGLNTWAVYSAASISWRKCELQATDRKTRKLFTIYQRLHPNSDVDRLYIPREDGGRGLIAIEDSVELEVRCLEVYVPRNEERMLQAARGDTEDGLEAASVLKKAKKENRLQDWEKKALHGQYLRRTKEGRSRVWLQNGDLKMEIESLIVAAQNQSIKTNLVKAKIDKSQKDALCRLCKNADKSTDHVVSGCSKLAQK